MKLLAVAHLPSSEKDGLEWITKFQAKKEQRNCKNLTEYHSFEYYGRLTYNQILVLKSFINMISY